MLDEFDSDLPRWSQSAAITRVGGHALHKPRTAIVTHKDGERAQVVIPNNRYERAIDPAGHIIALITSSNRDDAGDSNYDRYVRTTKRTKGWIFIDEAPFGITLPEWHKKCRDEQAKRTKLNEERQNKINEKMKSRQQELVAAASFAAKESVRTGFDDLMQAMRSNLAQGVRKGA